MSKIYTSQPFDIEVTITFDSGDLSTATAAAIHYKSPDGTIGRFTGASIDSGAGTITYSVSENEITQSGTWEIQPFISFSGGNSYPGSTAEMEIYPRFS